MQAENNQIIKKKSCIKECYFFPFRTLLSYWERNPVASAWGSMSWNTVNVGWRDLRHYFFTKSLYTLEHAFNSEGFQYCECNQSPGGGCEYNITSVLPTSPLILVGCSKRIMIKGCMVGGNDIK